MDPTPANLDSFFLGLANSFWQGYNTADIFWQKIAMLVPSVTSSTLQGWMDKVPAMRKWEGARNVNAPLTHRYRLDNDPYEDTLAIDKWEVEDDEHLLYGPKAAMLGQQAAKWPDYMLSAMLALNSGDGPTAFDGKTFFATDHPCDTSGINTTSTYANKFTSTALSNTNFNSVRAAMMGWKGADGKPMGIIPDLLVVPPSLEYTARTLMNATFIAPQTVGGITQVGPNENVLKGMCDVLVIPELEAISSTSWYLLCTKKPIKPFIFQQRTAPLFVYKGAPTDDDVFYKHRFVWGVEARGTVGVSLPFLAARATA